MARLAGPSGPLVCISAQQPDVAGEQHLPELRSAPCTEVRVGAASKRQHEELRTSS